jgi:hypothetical protein
MKAQGDGETRPFLHQEVQRTMNDLKTGTKPFLSLCMIVKNEKEHLPRCLTSVQPYVDEIVVVDTGSNDGTPEIASSYGAKVGYFAWCDDFAAARNYALSLVTGEWVLVLDADEELVIESGDFKEVLRQSQFLGYFLARTEIDDGDEMAPHYAIRLFRNLPELRYTQRFHEQLKYQNQWLPDAAIGSLSAIKMLHYGNSQTQIQTKTLYRNIPILEKIRQEEGLSLMLLYCLASMYRDTQQIEQAENCYVEAFDRLLPNLLEGNAPEEFGFVPSLLFSLVMQALAEQDYETAQLLCHRGLEWYPTFPPLVYAAGVLLRGMGLPLEAIVHLKQCLKLGREGTYYTGEPFELAYTTVYPACDIGNIYLNLERWADAAQAFELALSFDPDCTVAQQNLHKVKQLIHNQQKLH